MFLWIEAGETQSSADETNTLCRLGFEPPPLELMVLTAFKYRLSKQCCLRMVPEGFWTGVPKQTLTLVLDSSCCSTTGS